MRKDKCWNTNLAYELDFDTFHNVQYWPISSDSWHSQSQSNKRDKSFLLRLVGNFHYLCFTFHFLLPVLFTQQVMGQFANKEAFYAHSILTSSLATLSMEFARCICCECLFARSNCLNIFWPCSVCLNSLCAQYDQWLLFPSEAFSVALLVFHNYRINKAFVRTRKLRKRTIVSFCILEVFLMHF